MPELGPCLREEITDSGPVSVADALEQCAKVLGSVELRQSQVLKAIFAFVTEQSIKGNISGVKEYTVATEVLRQPADFDGKENNLVRVHANRLRKRLQLYYAGSGSGDAVVIRLPPGTYVPRFSYRSSEVAAQREMLEAPARRRWLLAAGLLLAGFLAGLLSSAAWFSKSSSAQAAKPGSHVYRFWKPFIANGAPPLIVLGQRRFLLNSKGAYLPFDGPQTAPTGTWFDSPDSADRLQFADAITGLGTAEGAILLSRAFLDLGVPATVRKSRLLRVEDLRTNNTVSLGAAPGNPLLTSILENAANQFSLDGDDRTSFKVERDPKTGAIIRDFGRISVLPGLAEGRWAVVLTGNWTFGTLAAARFCTEQKRLKELLEFPGFAKNGEFPEYFQAVIRGDLVQGELAGVRLISARALEPRPKK